MNRFLSCPLNQTCQKSDDFYYRHRTDLKNCKNYFECRVLSAAWKFPIERHYDKCGQYWEVKTTPTISEWYDHPSNTPYCPVRFFTTSWLPVAPPFNGFLPTTQSHIEIGYWFHRDLPLPTRAEEKDCLTVEEIVAMEIRQTYHRIGFFEAVPIK